MAETGRETSVTIIRVQKFRVQDCSLWGSKIRVPNFFFLGEGKVPLKYFKTFIQKYTARIEDVKVTTVHAFQSNEETA